MPDLTGSQMRYLHVIYTLSQKENSAVRSVEIAHALGISKASVHRMLKALTQMGLLTKQHYGDVCLTGAGLSHCEKIQKQYEKLYPFFFSFLGLTGQDAVESTYSFLHNLPEVCICRLMEKRLE